MSSSNLKSSNTSKTSKTKTKTKTTQKRKELNKRKRSDVERSDDINGSGSGGKTLKTILDANGKRSLGYQTEHCLPPRKWLMYEGWTFLPTEACSIGSDGRTFRKTNKNGWNCATRGSEGWDSGRHVFTIRTMPHEKMIIGICRENISFIDVNSNSDKCCGYTLSGYTGEKVDDCPGRPYIPDGYDVSVVLDLDAKTLSFSILFSFDINDKWESPPIFLDISDGKWFPYIVMYSENASIKLFNH